ncbi:MAG: phenylacetate--CoA ligase family protein [Planctomycetes bacterium]|nr:phenylacetate--CoA ligase family protein [Planctomycetota bacterium]
MSSLKEKIYWKMPGFAKNWLASAQARKLDRQRFGPDYDRALEEIAAHDKWTAGQFVEYQNKKLAELVRHAAANVPYYRRLFADCGIEPGQIKSTADLHRLPILDKATVRRNPESFVDENLKKSQLVILHTSGTTGTPLKIYRDTKLNSAALAYFDGRCHAVAGMQRRINRSVSIGGFLVAAPERTRPPFWVENRRWKQLYMSSYHLSPRYLGHYVDQLRRFGGEYIEGYASSVYAIAHYIADNGLEPVFFKACFTTADTLFDYHREAIRKAFGCETFNQYGCGEMAVFAAECEQGAMHLSPETGFVEVVDDTDKPVEPGQTGNLICTSLINFVQPFIRYRVGDRGALRPGQCSCGSPLPMLGDIEGRDDAVLMTADGRKIGRLDPIFKGAEGIAEAQIVQDDYDKFIIRIVPGKDYTDLHGKTVAQNLRHRVGEADISIETVETIERTSSGKFRAVICNLK